MHRHRYDASLQGMGYSSRLAPDALPNVPTSGHRTTLDDDRTHLGVEDTPEDRPMIVRTQYQDESINSAAKYECQYCGKGFNRPSSLRVIF